MAKVFVGVPTYDGGLSAGAARGAFACGTKLHQTATIAHNASLICYNMNALYAMALTSRKTFGTEWFAMLHADISPPVCWIDALIDRAEEVGADLMTAISPIKDKRGLTSTGIGHPNTQWIPWSRLTLKQVNHESFPETFDIDGAVDALAKLPDDLRLEAPKSHLLVNTAAMVVRVNRPFSEHVHFSVADKIFDLGDGKFLAKTESEDWRFGKEVAARGGRVFATSVLGLEHHGDASYNSYDTWGQDRDDECISEHSNVTFHVS